LPNLRRPRKGERRKKKEEKNKNKRKVLEYLLYL
jgi:hypothetical protein